MKYTLAVLVDNKPGVLTHIAGLISRRAFNIESIAAGHSEEPDITRINIVVDVDDDIPANGIDYSTYILNTSNTALPSLTLTFDVGAKALNMRSFCPYRATL